MWGGFLHSASVGQHSRHRGGSSVAETGSPHLRPLPAMSIRKPKSDRKDCGCSNLSDKTDREFSEFPRPSDVSNNSRTRPSQRSRPTSPRRPDDETDRWLSRLSSLQESAASLDSQMEKCLKVLDGGLSGKRRCCGGRNVESRDLYPRLARRASGRGYIRPPRDSTARRRYPLYKADVCYPPQDFVAELRASERGQPPYIPGSAKTRGDRMRWLLRERMQCSHPDYRL
jgi:hypothetical protein